MISDKLCTRTLKKELQLNTSQAALFFLQTRGGINDKRLPQLPPFRSPSMQNLTLRCLDQPADGLEAAAHFLSVSAGGLEMFQMCGFDL